MNSIVQQTRSEQFFDALRVLRVYWVVPILAFLTLALPAQVRDLYRTLAESGNLAQIAITASLLLLTALLVWHAGRHRARVRGRAPGSDGPLLGACLTWGPAVCASAVLAAAALGLYLAAFELPIRPVGIDSEIDGTLAKMAVASRHLLLASAAVGVVALAFLLTPLVQRWTSTGAPEEWPPAFAFPTPVMIASFATALAMISLAFFPRTSVPFSQWLGSLATFFLFLCVLVVTLSLLQSLTDRQGIPWIFLLLLWGVALAVFDRGESHRARLVSTPTKGHGLIQLQYAFQEWYRERKDRDAYRGEPYPVYLVAAEAGGLYAAQFTAKVLARLQDLCPNFAQHVFAISGVSGGSLGATVFASLAKKHAVNGPWKPCKVGSNEFEKKVDEILRQDLLAPIVSRAFFADFLQRFLPYPLVVPHFSRGRALEEAIEHAWARVEGWDGSPFSRAYLGHWAADDAGPALLLNTTSVSDGRQIVITPFGSDNNVGFDVGYLHLKPEFPTDKDLTLGSAVSLSGRFPWILPVATVGDSGLALVDGAYFEGSGVESLLSFRNALRQFEVKPTAASDFPYVNVHVLVIGSSQPPVGMTNPAQSATVSGPTLDELTPPLRTMLNARERRGYLAQNTLRDWSHMIDCPPVRPETLLLAATEGGGGGNKIDCRFRPPLAAKLNYAYFKLPLGWHISDGMRAIIDRHSRGRCTEQARTVSSPTAADKVPDPEFAQAREILMQNSLIPVEVSDQLWAGRRDQQNTLKVECN